MIPVHFRDPDTGKPATINVEDCDDHEQARQLVAETLPQGHKPILAAIAGGRQPEAAPGPSAA